MVVQYHHFSGILPDNDMAYFTLLKGVIASSDPLAQMAITRGHSAYHFRIIPSNTSLIDALVEEVITLSNLIGIQLDISKSIKTSAVINFSLSI